MPMKRKNKAPRGNTPRNETTEWFRANKKRQRARARAAKASRKKNRK